MTDSIDPAAAQRPAVDAAVRRATGRSPMYPFFDLERSLARARQLFTREKIHATPVMTALKHWGYTNASGKGGMTLSALKQFGLLEDAGRGESRRVQLTTRAYDILHTPHEEERVQLLREAALSPEIHQEMWDEFGSALPSDQSLAWTLTKERGFTSSGAEDFIRQWKRTMEFSRLAEMGQTSEEALAAEGIAPSVAPSLDGEPDLDDVVSSPASLGLLSAVSGTVQSSPPRPLAGVQSYPIPIALHGRNPVVVSGPFPLTEHEWTQFMAVLGAMKPVLAGAALKDAMDVAETPRDDEPSVSD